LDLCAIKIGPRARSSPPAATVRTADSRGLDSAVIRFPAALPLLTGRVPKAHRGWNRRLRRVRTVHQ